MKRKLLYSILLIFCFNHLTSAQLQSSKWYFGNEAGIDLNDGTLPPSALTDGVMNAPNASLTVNDTFGNLLFYSDGVTIWNANHTLMPNGTGLFGNANNSTVLAVPKPSDPGKYLVFTTENDLGSGNGLNYSIVDMSLDTGLGDVSQKNVNILSTASQKMTLAMSDDQTFYWLIVFAPSSDPTVNDTFYSYKISESGISLESQSTFTYPYEMSIPDGQMKVSTNGSFIGMTHNILLPTEDRTQPDITQNISTYNFDSSTGQVSNQEFVTGLIQNRDRYNYGIEFSPDSNFLYFSSTTGLNGLPIGKIYQYDYQDGVVYGTFPFVAYQDTNPIYSLQLAIDDKIYSTNATGSLGVINNPNGLESASNFSSNSIALNGKIATKGLPRTTLGAIGPPSPCVKVYNTSYNNDQIFRLKAKDSGVVVFGEIGSDNVDNLAGLSPGFIAEYDRSCNLLQDDTLNIPYGIQLDLQENLYNWVLTSTNGPNENYSLAKYNNTNNLLFNITTTNINGNVLEDENTGDTFILFPTSSYQDVSINDSFGNTWSLPATQVYAEDGTIFTKTLHVARINSLGVLVSTIELLNYEWYRTDKKGTANVIFPSRVIENSANIYFNVNTVKEDKFKELTQINLSNGTAHEAGEWLHCYNISNNNFIPSRQIGVLDQKESNELYFNNSNLFRKYEESLFKLNSSLSDISLVTYPKLQILESNTNTNAFIIRGGNERTVKKIDTNFNEFWSQDIGQKFIITHGSEAPNGDVYISGNFEKNVNLINPLVATILHTNGIDAFVARIAGTTSNANTFVLNKVAKQKYRYEFEISSSNNNEFLSRKIAVFPNPFNEYINIDFSNKNNIQSIEIFNAQGAKVAVENIINIKSNNKLLSLKTSSLLSGFYFIKINYYNSENEVIKVIKTP